MGNSEFDKYIRSHTEKDLTPPVDLNWENMDIPLPSEKKKDRAIYFYFIGFLILVGGLVWFGNRNRVEEEVQVDSHSSFENQSSLALNTNPMEKSENAKQDIYNNKLTLDEMDEDQMNKSSIVSENRNRLTNTPQSSNNNTIDQSPSFSNKFVFSNEVLSEGVLNISLSNDLSIQEKQSQLNQSQLIVNDNPSDEVPRLKTENPSKISDVILMLSPIQDSSKVFDLPMFNKNLGFNNLNKSKFSILLGFGLNTFQSNFNNSNQTQLLHDAESLAYGKSFNLTFKYGLKNNFFTSLGVSYQELHSTFSYREDLGVVNNLVDFTRVQRTKVIFHNNYFEDVSLNLGVGRTFDFNKKVGFDFSLNLNPTLRINSEGRSINDNLEVIYIEEFQPEKNLYWSAGGRLDLFYKVKNNKIFTGFGFTQGLTKINLLEGSGLSHQPQVFIFNTGIERKF